MTIGNKEEQMLENLSGQLVEDDVKIKELVENYKALNVEGWVFNFAEKDDGAAVGLAAGEPAEGVVQAEVEREDGRAAGVQEGGGGAEPEEEQPEGAAPGADEEDAELQGADRVRAGGHYGLASSRATSRRSRSRSSRCSSTCWTSRSSTRSKTAS